VLPVNGHVCLSGIAGSTLEPLTNSTAIFKS
jgi:hypothetical protein